MSKARSESPDIVLASDDSSSLVKNGSPEDMEMDDDVVDQVDAVIAALQKYMDNESEVSPSNWYGYSPEPIPVEDTNTQLKENFWNSPEDEEIVSPVEEPGVTRVCPKTGVSVFREDTSELDDKV